MALIIAPIPSQAFELIRDRIGEILLNELDNQVTTFYDPSLEVDVLVESSVPEDKTEIPVVNVNFAGGPLESKNAKDGTSAYTYNIDVYASAKSTENQRGDNRSALRCQRIIGACRSILQNPVYKTLAFVPGAFVAGITVRDIGISDPGAARQDAISTYMGRLAVIVNAVEIESLIIPATIAGYDAKLKIGDSESGFKYTGNE